MSVNQSKNIKNNTPADEKKYRSIRLTKAHRDDIVAAVMKQWVATNPPNDTATHPDKELMRAVLKKYAAPTRSTPPEFRTLGKVLELTREIRMRISEASEATKAYLTSVCHTTSTISVDAVDAAGNKRTVCTTNIPTDLADEMRIPYVHVDGVNHAHFYVRNKYETVRILIPQDGPEFLAYQDARKALTEWNKQKESQQAEIVDYLNQFNTTNQIRESWPELVPYLPAHLADPEQVIKLPVLALSRLNERLGLK